MINGTYFELEYFVEVNEKEDNIKTLKLQCSTYQKHSTEDQALFIGIDGYSRWLYHEDLVEINGVKVYLAKDTLAYEYIPNKLFTPFTYGNWDIDDFDDSDRGYEIYLDVICNQSDFDYEIEKVRYVGVILSEDEGTVKSILNDLEKEFYRENEIQ